MATFPEIMYSQPSFLQSSTMATLMSSAKTLASGWSLYQSVSNLRQSWGGSSQLAQAGQATTLMTSGQQVLTSITRTQTQISSAATQMQAAKVKLTTLVTAARAEGFIVLPIGQVIPSPPQLNPYTAAYYKARATVYNAQISAVVATTTASDLQNGLALAKTGVDILSAIMNRNGSAPTPAPTGVDPTTLTGANIGAPTLPADQIGVGTGLAGVGGVGDLHGIMSDGGLGGLNLLPGGGLGPGLGAGGTGPGGLGPGLGGAGGAGVGSLGGALVGGQGIGAGSRLGGGPGLFGGGSGGAGVAGAGTAGAGTAGEPGGGRGPGGTAGGAAGGTAMIGMGAPGQGGAVSDDEREARGWLLAEDEDAWTPADVADTSNGVIS